MTEISLFAKSAPVGNMSITFLSKTNDLLYNTYIMTTWIFPSNPNDFDTMGAFKELKVVDWGTRFNLEIGDIVYLYSKATNFAPIGRIILRTKVIKYFSRKVDVIDDRKFWKKISPNFDSKDKGWVRLQLLGKVFDDATSESLTYYNLGRRGLKSTLQGQLKLDNQPRELLKYINSIVDP